MTALTLLFLAMVVFAVITNAISRREGGGISRHPFGSLYSDATAARSELD
ncbi:MAG TPA: hypothetical protein VGN69_08235 [Solirubrobacteraceae bacterium]|jgi:hypothetical protein|nr:hypothetical protein [Solirubrobacteraceae bacterium]